VAQIHGSKMMMMMINLYCIGLNKCSLFSKKHNGMASIEMANINLRKSQNYYLYHIHNQSILKFTSSLLVHTLTVIWAHTRTTIHTLFPGHVLFFLHKNFSPGGFYNWYKCPGLFPWNLCIF